MSTTDENVEDLPLDSEPEKNANKTGEVRSIESDDDKHVEDEEIVSEEEPSHYNSEDFISGARISKNGTLPMNILEF